MTTLFVIGRTIVGAYFLNNAYNHLVNHAQTTAYAKMKGIPMPGLAVGATGLLLLAGGASLLLNIRPTLGVILLLVFLVPTTYLMHSYWKAVDPMVKGAEKIQFLKNCALIGFLLMTFAIPLPWPTF